jgi:signal transduction histidine kinase
MMELMQFSFYIILSVSTAIIQGLIPPDSIFMRRILGGAAVGFIIAALTQLFNIPITFLHQQDTWIAVGGVILVGGYFILQIYIKIATRFEAELEASRQERLAAIGRLASITAHEIRNPLQAIRGLSQFLVAKSDDAELKESAEVIMNEVDHLDVILRRLLEFSRELKLNLDKVDLGTWWDELRSIGEEMASTASLESIWENHCDGVATFDQDKMRQVFLNVFKNALEASPTDGKVLSTITSSAGKLIIRIEDEGPGISPQGAENAFKEFHTTKSEGSGLGLPISKRIVEAHDGKIYFDMNVKSGAAVVVEWPFQPPKRILRMPDFE